jgi:hypothetical protein
MNYTNFISAWQPCLGQTLSGGKKRLHPYGGVEVANLDLAELVLCFNDATLTRYLSWEQAPQFGGDFMLAAQPKTFLIDEPDEPFPEIPAEKDQVLSQFIGQIHTEVELILNEDENLMAAVFYFERACFIAAVGVEHWDDVKQKSEFGGFGGNDLFIWTPEQFIEALRTSPSHLKFIKCPERFRPDAP